MGLTLLTHAHIPLKFWVEAFATTVHIINLLPASTLKFQYPFSVIYRKEPDYMQL